MDIEALRRLADVDLFWKGAVWMYDHIEAERREALDAYFEASEATRLDPEPPMDEILAACREGRADLAEERRKINNRAARELADMIDTPVANPADLGAPRVP